MAEVAALDEVEIIAQVVEQYVPHVRVGMEVNVEIPAVGGDPLTGVVSAVVPQADVQARTFPVKVRVKNQLTEDGPLVKSGMYARVMLPTGDKQLAMLVPKDALVLGGAAAGSIRCRPGQRGGETRQSAAGAGATRLSPGQHDSSHAAGSRPGRWWWCKATSVCARDRT